MRPTRRAQAFLIAGEVSSAALFLYLFAGRPDQVATFLGLFAAGLVVTHAVFARRARAAEGAERFLGWVLILRSLLWAVAALPLVPTALHAPLAAAYFGLLLGTGRGVVYRRILDRTIEPTATAASRAAYQRHTLFERLVLSVDALGTLAGHALMLFVLTFMDVGRDQIRQAWVGLPIIAGSLLFARWGVTARLVKTLGRRLDAGDSAGALRLARALPGILAGCHLGSWVLSGVVGLAGWSWRLALHLDDQVIILALAVLLVWGVVLYQMRWHRAILAPFEERLPRGAPGPSRRSQSLRFRMLSMFGYPVLFACALSLFASVTQYRQLATALVEREAEDRADPIAVRLAHAPDPRAMHRTVSALRPPVGMIVFVVTRAGEVWHVGEPAAELIQLAQQPPPAPTLPRSTVRAMRRGGHGRIEIGRPLMTGTYLPIPGTPAPGAVAVLLPGYRGAGRVGHIVGLSGFFLALAIVAGGVVVWASQELAVPVRRLGQTADAIASGELGSTVGEIAEPAELAQLSTSLERMRRVLVEKIQTIEELNVGLEAKVSERTGALQRTNQELADALEKLKSAQAQLVHSEKMASLGQLVAGVAHEINNPLNFILNTLGPLSSALGDLDRILDAYATLEQAAPGPATDSARAEVAARRAELGLDETRVELHRMVQVLTTGAERAVRIVTGLRTFSRAESGDPTPFDLQAGLEESLALVGHLLRDARIEVARDFVALPPLRCRGSEINQVFLNLLSNAIQASPRRIVVRTRVHEQPSSVEVSIVDDGSGISPEAVSKIFDPFYTTKPVGKGTGLGLSISLGIIQAHGGTIQVDSTPGEGTTFRVRLPLET